MSNICERHETHKVYHAHDTALVIMARHPTPGQTKTRLGRIIGDREAADLYQAFLIDLAQRFAPLPDYTLCWAYTPAAVDYQAYMQQLVPSFASSMRYFPQTGEDFNTRLLNAFRWTHAHGYQRTILIGSDSPHLTTDTIIQANKVLDSADVVLGPAEDGGYYLIAMHQPYDVFSGIPMSTSIVLEMTLESARRQHLTVRQLDILFDIDEVTDLQRLALLLTDNSALAPATAAHLATIRTF